MVSNYINIFCISQLKNVYECTLTHIVVNLTLRLNDTNSLGVHYCINNSVNRLIPKSIHLEIAHLNETFTNYHFWDPINVYIHFIPMFPLKPVTYILC